MGLAQTARTIITRGGMALQRMTRSASARPFCDRASLIGSLSGKCLEIGPFDYPQLRGQQVSYFDVMDREGLQARAQELGRDPANIPPIHYVSPIGNLAVVEDTFDCVFSSHAIEHQPDLVAHLSEVERILAPAGTYALIIPDKRYCFDHFNPLTTLQDVLAAHQERRTHHTDAAIRAHRGNLTRNDALRHWLGLHGKPASESDPNWRELADKDIARAEAGEYVDVHAWMFTPDAFEQVIDELRRRDLIGLRLDFLADTRFGQHEFYAKLVKS